MCHALPGRDKYGTPLLCRGGGQIGEELEAKDGGGGGKETGEGNARERGEGEGDKKEGDTGGGGDETGDDLDEDEEDDPKSLYLYVGRYDVTMRSAPSTSWKIDHFIPAPGVSLCAGGLALS